MHISVTPKQAPSDDEYPFVGTPTPHRTPQLATARRRQRQQFSAVKAVPPPLTPQWLPRVFAHADEHGDKATASNLTSSLVPSDEAITTWQQYTQQVGDVLFSFFSALHRRGFTCPATEFPPTSFVTALGTTGARSFIRAGKTCTLALISEFGRELLLHFRSRGEAWRG